LLHHHHRHHHHHRRRHHQLYPPNRCFPLPLALPPSPPLELPTVWCDAGMLLTLQILCSCTLDHQVKQPKFNLFAPNLSKIYGPLKFQSVPPCPEVFRFLSRNYTIASSSLVDAAAANSTAAAEAGIPLVSALWHVMSCLFTREQ
jgi:hypothetical protein